MAGSDDKVNAGEVESNFAKLSLTDAAGKVEKPSISFSIWPPSERTRKAVVKRLVENLTAESPMLKRYGRIPAEEAEVTAKEVEEEAFKVAGGDEVVVEGDGIEVLQVYSKEISRRMLEVLKGRVSSGGEVDKDGAESNEVAENVSSVDNESN